MAGHTQPEVSLDSFFQRSSQGLALRGRFLATITAVPRSIDGTLHFHEAGQADAREYY